MKKTNSISKFILTAAILSLICFGCNKKDESPTPANKQSTNTSANSAVSNGNSNANANVRQ